MSKSEDGLDIKALEPALDAYETELFTLYTTWVLVVSQPFSRSKREQSQVLCCIFERWLISVALSSLQMMTASVWLLPLVGVAPRLLINKRARVGKSCIFQYFR